MKRNAQVFSGQRCDARLCLGSDGCRARRGMVAWSGEEEDEELGVVGRGLAMDNQTQSPLISSQTKLETRERPDQTKTRAPITDQIYKLVIAEVITRILYIPSVLSMGLKLPSKIPQSPMGRPGSVVVEVACAGNARRQQAAGSDPIHGRPVLRPHQQCWLSLSYDCLHKRE